MGKIKAKDWQVGIVPWWCFGFLQFFRATFQVSMANPEISKAVLKPRTRREFDKTQTRCLLSSCNVEFVGKKWCWNFWMEGMGVGEDSGEMRWNTMIEPGLDMDIIPLYWCAIGGCFLCISLSIYYILNMHLYGQIGIFHLNFGVTGQWEKNYPSSYCWCFQKYGSGIIWIHTMPEN